MIPVAAIKSKKLPHVEGLAILIPAKEHHQTFLITEAQNPIAIFLDGSFSFHAFQASQGENWDGAVVEGLAIEVDVKSIYSVSNDGPKLGSVVKKGNDTYLVAKVKNGDWTDLQLIPLVPEQKPIENAEADAVGFQAWTAVIGSGADKALLYEAVARSND